MIRWLLWLPCVYGITFYCMNMPTSTARRNRLEHRFKFLEPRGKLVVVPGIYPTSGLSEYYSRNVETHKWNDRSDAGCSAAHLKGVRTFLESDEEYAFICEDDIMLHNNFWEQYDVIEANLPPNPPLVTYSFMMFTWEGADSVGLNPKIRNVLSITKDTWGGQLYRISRQYGMEILANFDHDHNKVALFNELWLHTSRGYIALPPLAIEESIDSDRKAPLDLPYHQNHFLSWGIDNYNGHELNDEF